MSSEPHDAPVPREAPSPPGDDLAAVVDDISQRVDEEVREVAARSREQDGAQDSSGEVSGEVSGDVVPDVARGDAAQPADPTLRADGGQGAGDDGLPMSEPTD